MKITLPLFAVLFVVSVFTACDDKDKTPLDIPSAYDGTAFETNAATQIGVLSRFTSLVNEAKKGRATGQTVSLDSLNYWYTAGNPTLQSLTSVYYSGKTPEWTAQLALASGNTYTPGVPTGNGGAYSGYLFDANGLELEQLLDKGHYGALLFHHFNELTSGTITEATVDQMLAIFGANPTFPNSYQANLHAQPDKLIANYAARRDKNDGKGFYTNIRDQFIKLQAAVKAGPDYNEERDEAIAEIRLLWEKANAATIINYLYAVISKLSATNPTDADIASALHSYGETVGFTHGFRTLENKKITDTEIDELLTLLNTPANGTPTSYKFATDPVNELPKLTQVISRLKSIYGFSDQEMEDFKKNWVSEQNR
ncbi:MAG: hypothetical protein DYG98_01825 [Haliscomenobacteraceae bacterium CHB4]|nr:hypothetical protein [Saprospiraceae bacterium]MCE7921770.1 hypothetical protein [Haliscomenobacteraceae bacterium CHB4]